jgi:hypothetical protein
MERMMISNGMRMRSLFLMGLVASRPVPERTSTFEMKPLPAGEAPESLRKPLLKGRRGKGTRKDRRNGLK